MNDTAAADLAAGYTALCCVYNGVDDFDVTNATGKKRKQGTTKGTKKGAKKLKSK